MEIDLEAIRYKFIKIARNTVGNLLATSGEGAEEKPAVMKHRTDGVSPNRPYITVEVVSIADEDGMETKEGVDEYDYIYTETSKELLIVYRCYGGDPLNILNRLNASLKLPSIRDSVRTDLYGSIVNVFDVTSLPIRLATKYLESASFNVIYNQYHRQTGEAGIIETVNVEPGFDGDGIEEVVIEDTITVTQ